MKNKTMLLVFACATTLYSQNFISQNTKIYINKTEVGAVELLTPVELLSKGDKMAKVKIKGVVLDNYPLAVQKSISQAQIFATFKENLPQDFNKVKELEDDYGEIWHEVEGIYEVDKSAITNSTNEIYKKAKVLYEENCSACHRLHEPESFTAGQWPANIQGMVNAGYVALEDDTLTLITKYLQVHSKK